MNMALVPQLPPSVRARTVSAVLGPTNTGKTHLAIERMLAQPSGLIGLPLRLLAREVYGRLVERAGSHAVALITGEEKIQPKDPRYWVFTVEAMPRHADVDFVAIDEVQLAGDLERGHVFTDRILNLRGRHETLLLGAATIRPLLEKLIPGINIVTRPRMSQLTYSGQKKITRLPARSALVAFSAQEVYAIAELIRRQRGGAAVVLGALSPRTRNAQVALYQSGDVDFLVATDAIGMGLNLDVDHISFAGNRKFDGYQYRQLTAAELGQIAGRAGRHTRDGTFGVTGRAEPLADELVQQLETHQFQPMRTIQWRNPVHDFSSVAGLLRSLDAPPREEGLTRAPPADDQSSLEHISRDAHIVDVANANRQVELLWEMCKVPDYRRIAPANHAELVSTLFGYVSKRGWIPDDWFARQIAEADRTEGDIDTLAARIAHIRTWTYVANRAEWLRDPNHWRLVTRAIEDRLSDALHERLTQRFVDRRTSVLMRRLRENAMLEAEISSEGDVTVEGHRVGHIDGFRFSADTSGDGADAKALRNAAAKALATEIESRAERFSRSGDPDFVMSSDGTIRWLGQAVARLLPGPDALSPGFVVLADEQLTGPAKEKVDARLELWVAAQIANVLKPLIDLRDAADLEGIARGVAFQLIEALGVVERSQVTNEIKSLDQTMRAVLRKYGVRFGAYHVFLPALLKPAPAALVAQLWSLKHDKVEPSVLAGLSQLSLSGRTSIPVDTSIPKALYRNVGYRVCGERAVRIDILERLADLIRPLIAWRPIDPGVTPPTGAVATGGGFTVTVAMTSLVGCSGEDFASILKALGYRVEKRKVPRPVHPAASVADVETVVAVADEAAPVAEGSDVDVDPAVDAAHEDGHGEARDEADVDSAAVTESGADNAAEVMPAPVEEPTDVVVTEASSGDTAEAVLDETVAPADVLAPVEAEFIEIDVWRPGRTERRDHGGEGRREGGRRAGGGGRREAQPKPAVEPKVLWRRGDAPPKPEQPQGGGERRPDPRKPDPRRDRDRDAPRDARPPRRDDQPAKRPEKQMDPDSPFAKLMALKANMESRGKDK